MSGEREYHTLSSTKSIRERLNFLDEARWKRFSARRLNLVELLSLSDKKASEQDDEISACAAKLMNEFNFPEETLPDFDKLVRLAIQSVRRNRKRSQKRLATRLELQAKKRQRLQKKEVGKDEEPADNQFMSSMIDYNGSSSDDNDTSVGSRMGSLSPSSHARESSTSAGTSARTGNTHKDSAVARSGRDDPRLAINSLIAPVIHDQDRLPSIRKLHLNPGYSTESQKILQLIKRSRACYEISGQGVGSDSVGLMGTTNSKNYELLEELGSSCVSAAVLYTLQKWFDHLSLDSCAYLKPRLKSDLTLSLIVRNLDPTSTEVAQLSEYMSAQLFKKLIGGCIKDFGFDAMLLPLADIFKGVVLRDYPLLSKESKLHQQLQQTHIKMPFAPLGHFEAVPPPVMTNTRKITSVIIKYNDRELKFVYSGHNNAPPTLLELVTNSKTAFGIVGRRAFTVKYGDREIVNDIGLTKLFREDREKVVLELVPTATERFLNLGPEGSNQSSPGSDAGQGIQYQRLV